MKWPRDTKMALGRITRETATSAESSILAKSVLGLQRELLVDRNAANIPKGFLISAFDEAELRSLLDRGGVIHTCVEDGRLLGYSLVVDIHEFTGLHRDAGQGRFEPNAPIDEARYDYLYQIAVAPAVARSGLGGVLLARCKTEATHGLLADVLVSPLFNEASLCFLAKHDFREVGNLFLPAYRDFGELVSRVLVWDP